MTLHRMILPLLPIAFVLAAIPDPAAGQATKAAKRLKKDGAFNTSNIQDAVLAKRLRIPLSSIGYLLIDARTGAVVAQRQPTEAFAPASAIKVPTTVAALAILGGKFRFKTRLVYTGEIKAGVLTGNLFLVGGGDPVLTTDDYLAFIKAMKTAGITKVAGKFHYDVSLFDATREISKEHSPTAAYNSGIGPLSLNFNRVKLKWQRGRKPEDLEAKAISRTDKIEIEVDFLSFGMATGKRAGFYGLQLQKDGDGYRWMLGRRVRRKGEIWLPVKRPALHAAQVFRKLAEREGVEIPKGSPSPAPADARLLHQHESVRLPVIVHKVLKFSNNMAAEMVGIRAALELTGRLADGGVPIRDSSQILAAWLKGKAEGTDFDSYDVHNHSGLTTKTRVSPAQMVSILRFAARQRYGALGYPDLLKPYWVGGGRRERNFPAHIRVWAKTGTINYVRALAGYLTTRKKRKLVFALFISDAHAHKIAREQKRTYKSMGVRRWMWRSRQMQRAIVRRWALEH